MLANSHRSNVKVVISTCTSSGGITVYHFDMNHAFG